MNSDDVANPRPEPNLFEVNKDMIPGDVTLLFTGNEEPRFFMNTWLRSIAAKATQEDRTTPVVVIGLAASAIGEENIETSLEAFEDKLQYTLPELISLTSEEGDALLANYPSEKKGAIVAVSDLERFRTNRIDSRKRLTFETVDGTRFQQSELGELCLPHVTELCFKICQMANNQKQRCLLLCRGYGYANDIPSELKELSGLDIIQVSQSDEKLRLVRELRNFLDCIPQEGIGRAWSWVENNFSTGLNQQIAFSNLLSADGRHAEAYKVVEEFKETIIKEGTNEMVLMLAQTAAAAGDRTEAISILTLESFPPVSRLNFEGLRAACILSDELNLDDPRSRYREALWTRFPNNAYSLSEQFRDRVDANDYDSCRGLADKMKCPYRSALANFLETPTFPPEVLLRTAEATGDLPQALWIAATTAKQAGRLKESRSLAKQLRNDGLWGGRALELRAQILIVDGKNWKDEEFQKELIEVVAWVSENPGELGALFAVDEIFENSSIGLHAVAVSAYTFVSELKRILENRTFSSIGDTVHLLGKTEGGSKEKKLLINFMEQFLAKRKPNKMVVGVGSVPKELKSILTPDLLAELGNVIQYSLDKDDTDLLPLLAHITVLVSRELNDHNSDLFAVRSILGHMTSSNDPQKGLDFAVSMLLTLPSSQPAHQDWRRTIAWAIYADTYQRLGNPMSALRCTLAALLSLKEEPQNGEMFADLIRLCIRVTRDLKLYPVTRELIWLEKDFSKQLEASSSQFRIRQLEKIELDILLSEWTPSDGVTELREIERKTLRHLAAIEEGEEFAPMLAVLANVSRFMKIYRFEPTPRVQDQIETYFCKLPESPRSKLIGLITLPSTSLLRQLFDGVSSIRASDDLGYALKTTQLLARDALSVSKINSDEELFWVASLLLTQPAIALRLTELHSTPQNSDPVKGTKWLASRIEEDTNKTLDAVLVQRRLANIRSETKSLDLFDITLDQFRTIIAPEEIVVILVSDDSGSMFRAIITSDGIAPLEQLPLEEWSSSRYFEWSEKYPSAYGIEFKICFETVLSPTHAAVVASVAKLNPLARVPGRKITIIPEGGCFGFAHQMTGKLSIPDGVFSVAPSARWLYETRNHPQIDNHSAVAWLGAPTSQDGDLLALRTGLRPILKLSSVTELESKNLPSLSERDLVVIGSHGSLTGKNATFSKITDKEHSYEVNEVASSLSGTNCVVLFVCNAGRVDQGLYSHSTTGLVSSLLRHGVRCVVAPLWALDVPLAVCWMREFLETDPNSTIAERATTAQAIVAGNYKNHPLVNSVFSVFGDGTTKCTAVRMIPQ